MYLLCKESRGSIEPPLATGLTKLQGQFMLVCNPIFHSGHLHSDESLHCSIHK